MAYAYDPNEPEDEKTGVPQARQRILTDALGGEQQAPDDGFLASQAGQTIQPVSAAAPAGNAASGYEFNAGNVFDNYDLNPLAGQIGGGADGVRDTLATKRDAFLQPLMQQYRSAVGVGNGGAAADDAGLFADQGFQSFVQGGQLPSGTGAAPSSTGGGTPGPVSPFTSQLRDILMQQLRQASQPVGVDDPGVREILAGQRLGLQRGSERQKAQLAETLASQGLSNSGAAETGRMGIEQQRGEAEAQGAGQVLSQELGQRRQQLQNLLQLALQSGDNESARQIQMQIAQMNNSLGQDQLAFNYAGLNQSANLAALNAILGLGA